MLLAGVWLRRGCLIAIGMFLLGGVWLATAAAAPALIVPMQVQQGSLVSLKIPQFDSGMSGAAMAMFNEQYRQEIFRRLHEFEAVAYETRLTPKLPAAVKSAMKFMADYEVFRSDARLVSLTQKVYQFTGGAHGMSWQIGHTIDLETARRIELPDLFAYGAPFAERLTRLVREEGAARNLPMWNFKGIGDNAAFYLHEDAIVLFFQPYEVAPYSEGIVSMRIPVSMLEDILRPEYFR